MTTGGTVVGPRTIALLLGAVFTLGAFVVAESNTASPLIQLSMFRDRVLSASLAMSTIVSTVLMSTLVVGPFYLSRALDMRTAAVGLSLSAGPLAAALAGVPAGRLVDRYGAQRMTIAGLIGLAIGASALALLPRSFGIAGYLGPLVVMTVNYALFQAANNTVIMADVRPEQRGVTSGMLSLSRNLGLITGASVMGTVFAVASGTTDVASAGPVAVATGMRRTFAVAAVLIVAAIVVASWSRAGSRQPPMRRLDR